MILKMVTLKPCESLSRLKDSVICLKAEECTQVFAAAAAKSLHSCLTPCNPIDGSPPDSLVPGILQARTLEWVAIGI